MSTFQIDRCKPGWLASLHTSNVFSGLLLTAAVSVSAVSFSNVTNAANLSESEKRGEYLANAGNCVSCHTTDNGSAFAGGLEFETPFGTIYSTNISSHPEDGIGQWTLEEFSTAMRQGKSRDGKQLYPVFPYTAFTKVSDQDIADIYAFLKTVKPVKYSPPENDLSFPYSQRWALGPWKTLYFDEDRFEPQADQSTEWNRGAYLVEGLGHCGMCHTPRNFLGAMDDDMAMTGGNYMENVEGKLSAWSAPNLTSSESGLAMWSVDDITDYLKRGVGHRAGVFGPMNKVVVNSTAKMSEDDVRAMAVYLKSLPANAQENGKPAKDDVLRTGSVQYDIHCGTCHLPTGEGSPETGPPLLGSPVVMDVDPSSLINIVLYGAQVPKEAPSAEWLAREWRDKPMEPFANKLNDEQAAALLSFLRNSWGHKAGAVSADQVATQR